jgi:aspartate/methionine/tyrosine aminotransferase
VSKISGLPQMKLAWIACSGPDALVATAISKLEVIADTYLSPGAPVQVAAPVLLQARHSIQRQLCQHLRANLGELEVQLAGQRLCRGLRVEGGWYAVLRVPATRSDEEFALALLAQRGVFVHPGHFFDFAHDGFLVLSLITPEDEFREGVQRLLGFANES